MTMPKRRTKRPKEHPRISTPIQVGSVLYELLSLVAARVAKRLRSTGTSGGGRSLSATGDQNSRKMPTDDSPVTRR
jgi:hypothetical protein